MSTASERQLAARIAAHDSWARTPDRSARTAPARAALMARFDAQVDPDGILTVEERTKRATSAKKAYFSRLALQSAKARRLINESVAELQDLEEQRGA